MSVEHPDTGSVRIAVVIPAYEEGPRIAEVIAGVPAYVDSVIVVDDASTDDTGKRAEAVDDPRVVVLRHEANRGVGAATVTGIRHALSLGSDIVVKMDGDGQMDPDLLPRLLDPLLRHEADVVKGNRYWSLDSVRRMPTVRMIGNAGLTFLVKLASGYWNSFDPANGYLALRTSVLRMLPLERLPDRFFFESGLLVELGILRAVVASVPMAARYGDDGSTLSVPRTLVSFPPKLLWGLCRRIFWRYYVHDFSAVSVFLLLGIPAFLYGVLHGASIWMRMAARGEFTPAGMVMLLAMPIILGFQLILQAIVLDVGNVPTTPLSPRFGDDPAARQFGQATGRIGQESGRFGQESELHE